jgi:hypothetical protein
MEKKKLYTNLKILNPEEVKRLRALTQSGYFRLSEACQRLLLQLLDYWPDYHQSALEKQQVWTTLFPTQAFEDKQWRYLCSDAVGAIESFWTIERLFQSGLLPDLLLHEALAEKKLEKNFQEVNRRLEARFAKSQTHDVSYLKDRLHWLNTNENAFQRSRQRRFDLTLQHSSDSLDAYYFLQKLQYACVMLDRQAILQGEYDTGISAAWLQHLLERDFFAEPLIELHYVILKALQEEEQEEHFSTVKQAIFAEKGQGSTLRDIYLFAINYCARKIRQGKGQYVQEALALYHHGLEREVLLEGQEISPWTFTNVVKLSLRLEQFAQIEQFIDRYADRLPSDLRADALAFNQAELYYYTGRIDEAQSLLNQVSYSDLNYYLGARVLLAKLYYETNASKALLSLLAAFTIFLKRNKQISSALKQTYLNFCNLLFQIIRRKVEQLPPLREQILETQLLTDRGWLLDIVDRRMTNLSNRE